MGNLCFLCAEPCQGLLCHACEAALPKITTACKQCSLPLTQNQLCGECLKEPPHFDNITCAFEYYFPLPHLVNAFKQRQHLRCGKQLACYLNQSLNAHYTDNDWPNYLCAVPMYWQKRLQRGFNQAEDIAKHLAAYCKQVYLPLLQKSRATASQQGLNRRDRLRNLTDSFTLNPAYREQINNCHLAIVDDVVTTGATAEVLSRLLKKHGARRVDIWAIARTPKNL